MNLRWIPITLCLSLLPASIFAQDAHSLGIGGAASAAPMGIFGVYWNPSLLALPDGSASGWSVATGFSAFDTSNSGVPIVHYSPDNGRQSSQDPIQRSQQYQGLFAVKYKSTGGGVLYDQELNTLTSQGALQFFHDRDKNSIGLLSSYSLSDLKTTQQIATLVVSYAMPLPLGSMQLFTIGGNLKYNDGLYYQQSSLTGTFTQGSPFSGTYTKTSSTSGLGLSMDFGFLAKISDSLQAGMMFQNIKSSFNWTATQQNFTLDPTTGAESPTGTASSVTISAPFPYATRLGMVYDPQEKNIIVEGEVSWSQQQTRWRAGLERFYPEASLVVRFGTFADEVTNQQMWCFGVGFVGKNVAVDGSFLTRSIPDLQDSITLGGALDAIISF